MGAVLGVDGDDVQGGAFGAQVLQDRRGSAACDLGDVREFADCGETSVAGMVATGGLPGTLSRRRGGARHGGTSTLRVQRPTLRTIRRGNRWYIAFGGCTRFLDGDWSRVGRLDTDREVRLLARRVGRWA